MPKKMIHKLSRRRRLQLIQQEIKSMQLGLVNKSNESNIQTTEHLSSAAVEQCGPLNVYINYDKQSSNGLLHTKLIPSNTSNKMSSFKNIDYTESSVLKNNFSEVVQSNVNDCITDKISLSMKLNTEHDLKSDLCRWIIDNYISHSAVNVLLTILNRHGHQDLPSDVRTLLGTPRDTKYSIIEMENGRYAHVGLSIGISLSIKSYFDICPDTLKVNINVDGLPLSASSGSQFWPIMGSIVTREFYTEPFIIGVFHGFKKPVNVNTFLRPFIEEAKLITKDGICIDRTKVVQIEINAIICDTPARAFICCVKGHTGYFGCSKCVQEGDFVQNRVTFPSLTDCLRTDDSFKNRQQEDYHVGSSCLEELNIGMVSQIPLDYMHLICLGVMKRLLLFWVRGKGNIKMKPSMLDTCSNYFVTTRCYVPDEFARKPRSLYDVDRWKATEFRLFLLYLGIVVLKKFLSHDYYYHFLSLSVAIRILVDPELCYQLNDYANALLTWFVECYGNLYGCEYYSYNVHNVIHLANDVKRFGALDQFSAFKYENCMQQIKKKIITNGSELQQLVNRLQEHNQLPLKTNFQKRFPYPKYFKINKSTSLNKIQSLQFNGFCISTKMYDNCCELRDGSIVSISNIYKDNETYYLNTECYSSSKPYFSLPCNSKDIGISVVNKSINNSRTITSFEIKRKCLMIKLPEGECEYVIIPLLHNC